MQRLFSSEEILSNNQCRHHKNEHCFDNIAKKFGKTFLIGSLVKFLLQIVLQKFQIMRVLRNYKEIFRFGLVCGFFSALFKGARCLFRKFNFKLGIDVEIFIASAISSLSLLLASRRDLDLMKMFIYPRAIEALYNLLVEKKLIRPIKYGETILCLLAMTIYTYNYIYEPFNIGIFNIKSLDRYCNITQGERQLIDKMRERTRNIIKDFYPYHRLLN